MTLEKTKSFVNSTVDVTHKKVVQPFIDKLLGRTMSRKLQVIIIATWLVYNNKISGDMWGFIALLYMLGLYWLNHVQAMAALGKNWMGRMGKIGSPEFRQYGRERESEETEEAEIKH